MEGGTTPFVLHCRITYSYVSHRPRPLYPGKRTEVRIKQEAWWAPKPVLTFRTGVQLFNKSMLKPVADQVKPDHTCTPQQFMLRRIYVLFSKFNSLSTGCPNKLSTTFAVCFSTAIYRGAYKSFARPGRKQARKHVRDARDFNNIETRAAIKLFFLQGKAPNEIQAILTETLACFLPGRSKDLSAPLYNIQYIQLPIAVAARSKMWVCGRSL